MALSQDLLDILACPQCKGRHTYMLAVERAVRLKVPSLTKKREKPSSVEVTQVFVCPLKERPFEASFYLQDTSSDRIRSVRVIGVAEPDAVR